MNAKRRPASRPRVPGYRPVAHHAPGFARTVDIHRKPGYDPVEMHFDFATKSIPLDATLVKGSHGAPAAEERQRGIMLSSQRGTLVGLGLNKLHRSRELIDTPEVRGMINKVRHLVRIDEEAK